MWMFFDRPLADGQLVADRVLANPDVLDRSARAYLAALRTSAMHLWEVADLVPGISLTLKDVLEGGTVTVRERSASRVLPRHEWIAARVVPRGASGAPEIERGMLPIPRLYQDSVRTQLIEHRAEFLRAHDPAQLSQFYKGLPPFFHNVWAGSILEPAVPELYNTDGERLLVTRVTYDVLDADQLGRALDAVPQLERTQGDETTWSWTGENRDRGSVSLGRLELKDERLAIEVNSTERGERARALVESIAGSAVKHRSTTHEDMTRRVRDAVRARALGGVRPEVDAPPGEPQIPREITESLVLNHMARHYREWVDHPVPALKGKTPRQAVGIPALRAPLLELLHGLEGLYEQALKAGQPAYDPSWMWEELGLDDERAEKGPPALAYERVAALVPGSAQLCLGVAQAERKRSGFSDSSTVLSDEECRANLELRRFVRDREHPDATPSAASDQTLLAQHLWAMVNFALHLRKAFWVDEGLAFMLAHTDLDVLGAELRLPFPAFALVFTDRHVLSLAERLLSRDRGNPVAGHLLRVLTVYAVEETRDARTVQLALACDAMGADLPAIVRHELRLSDEAPVQAQLQAVSHSAVVEPAVPDVSPLRALLTVVLNAILYATCPGIEVETRSAAANARRRPKEDAGAGTTTDEVYFLPGAIDITQLRRYQALERLPDGREILRRFMVRGHFRRAQKGWTDQRPRWIAPYWKGPDMAAIIERTYRLKP